MDDHNHCACCAYAFPDVMTEEQAVQYLQITDVKHPDATLKRWRDLGLLRGIRISRSLRYTKVELNYFCEKLAERQARQ